jgi:RNA polymerase sigma-70 factor (ECF subfamily)
MQRYKGLSDVKLIEMLRESNHAAYTEIFQRYFHLIFRHAVRKLNNEEIAKDIVQDVFTSLWLKRTTINIKSNLSGYLYVAARNQIFNFWAHEDVESKYWHSLVGTDGIEKYDSVATDFKIREKQLKDYIEAQVQKLPPKMRRIFELSRKELLSSQEIADHLGTSKGNVSKQITNSLKILRTKLGIVPYIYLLIRFWLFRLPY